MPLPAGVVFWRAFGMLGPRVGSLPSPTWELTVTRGAGRANSYGSTRDVDGDGHADLLIQLGRSAGGNPDIAVYPGNAAGIALTPATTLHPTSAGGGFGVAQGSAGDVNGDGFGDVIVGQSSAGAQVYLGGPSGLSTTPLLLRPGAAGGSGNAFGAGDIDGDGFGDVVVGDAEAGPTGAIWIFHGGPGGIADATAPITMPGPRASEFHLYPGGDIDADGYQDLIVADPEEFTRTVGRVDVFYGPDFNDVRRTSLTGSGLAGDYFGYLARGAVDVNGDGFCDLLVASSIPSGVLSSDLHSSVIYLYLGGADGLSSMPASQVSIDANLTSLSGADVSGDGRGDVIVSEEREISTRAYVYRTQVFSGSPTGLMVTASATRDDLYSGHPPGDVTGDGISDFGVAGPSFRLYEGGALGLEASPLQVLSPPPPTTFFGPVY